MAITSLLSQMLARLMKSMTLGLLKSLSRIQEGYLPSLSLPPPPLPLINLKTLTLSFTPCFQLLLPPPLLPSPSPYLSSPRGVKRAGLGRRGHLASCRPICLIVSCCFLNLPSHASLLLKLCCAMPACSL